MKIGDPKDIVSIHAFFGPDKGGRITPSEQWPELAAHVQAADVIFGVDMLDKDLREFLVYGRETLKRIADSESEQGEELRIMHIGVEMSADVDDLERLCVLVEHLKGRCDYIPVGGKPK